jgi:3-methyladenine DNA glycosylase AlkD
LAEDCERAREFLDFTTAEGAGTDSDQETMPEVRLTAREFIAALERVADAQNIPDIHRYFHVDPNARSGGNKILGVSFGRIFAVAKQFAAMPLGDVETLLESPYYEVRMGAVSIMDFQARGKRTTLAERKALFDLYIRRHDRINNWDLVDRAAPHVVGRYLADSESPRSVLNRLARSRNPWERRSAIVSTWYFIRAGELDDTFRIARLLAGDHHALVQKAVGSWLREAGKRDQSRLVQFLETHAAKMPRTMLRYAVEKLPAHVRVKVLE